jgi:hypothetical protein
MTPQHSSSPGRAVPCGITAQAYMRIKCYLLHLHAINNRVNNAINSGFRYRYLPVHRLVRYCFHCFQKRLTHYVHHLLRISFPHRGNPTLCCTALYVPHPPGRPPWYKFTNYLKTKNRPFYNPSSWAVPVTWRSLERK